MVRRDRAALGQSVAQPPFPCGLDELSGIRVFRRQHPNDFAWSRTIDRLTGSDKVRLAIEGGRLAARLEAWDQEAAAFKKSREPYLIYR